MKDQVFSRLGLIYSDLQEQMIQQTSDALEACESALKTELIEDNWNIRHDNNMSYPNARENFIALHSLLGPKILVEFCQELDFLDTFDLLFAIQKRTGLLKHIETKEKRAYLKESAMFIYNHRNDGGVPGAHTKPTKLEQRLREVDELFWHYQIIYDGLNLLKSKIDTWIEEVNLLKNSGTNNNLPNPSYAMWGGFSGREKLLNRLRKLVLESDYPIVALHGPGGVGKTALTRKLCEDIKIECYYSQIVWISAKEKSFDNIIAGVGPKQRSFVEETKDHLIASLYAVFNGEDSEEVLSVFVDDLSQLLDEVKEKLEDSKNKVLVVLDNYETITIAERSTGEQSALSTFAFEELVNFPAVHKIIITSREKINGASNERIGNLEKGEAHRFLDSALKKIGTDISFSRKKSSDRDLMHHIAADFKFNPIRLTHLIGWIKREASLKEIAHKITNSGLDGFVFDTSLDALSSSARELLFAITQVMRVGSQNLRPQDFQSYFGELRNDEMVDALEECKDYSCVFEREGIIELTSGLEGYLPDWARINHLEAFDKAQVTATEWLDKRKVTSRCVVEVGAQADLKDAMAHLKSLSDTSSTPEEVLKKITSSVQVRDFSAAVAAICCIRANREQSIRRFAEQYFNSKNSVAVVNHKSFWVKDDGRCAIPGVKQRQLYYLLNWKKHQVWKQHNPNSWHTDFLSSVLILWTNDTSNPFGEIKFTRDTILTACFQEIEYGLHKSTVGENKRRALQKLQEEVGDYLTEKVAKESDWHVQHQELRLRLIDAPSQS